MYRPVVKPQAGRRNLQVSTMAQKGLNLEGLPEMMKLEYAKKMVNYIPYSYGIGTRGGLEKKTDIPKVDIGDSPMGYWRFDEGSGTTVTDSSGNGNDGIATNMSWVQGKVGDSGSFDGVSGDVLIADNAAIQNIWDGGGSVSCWINFNSDGTNSRILQKAPKGLTVGWSIFVSGESGGAMKLNLYQMFDGDAGASKGRWRTGLVINTNQWHHIVIAYDSSSTANDPILYLDGVETSFPEVEAPSGNYDTDVGQDLYIGDDSNGGNTVDGEIDEVRLYDKVLTAQEISALYCDTDAITLSEYFTNDKFIVGIGTNIVSYDISTNKIDVIKTDFSASTRWGGGRYGEYFIVTNGVDKPYIIDNALAISIIAAAPICDDITFVGARAVAISLKTDETAVQISEVDDGTNPPFQTWSTGTDATDGAVINYRNAGKARSAVALGSYIVVFSDDGYFAFSVDTIDSAGTLKKVENVQDYITDFGGARGALSTPMGIFYLNEGGLYQMVQIGQTNVPYSRQQKLNTVLLDDFYFDNVNFGNVDMVYDERQRLVLVTYAKGSGINNKVLGYKVSEEIEGLFEIEGWTVNRFTKYDNKVYASSSANGKIYECFKGFTDDGVSISTEYTQELPLKSLWARHSLKKFYSKGFLSLDSVIDVHLDIYDKEGAPISSKRVNRWTPQRNDNTVDGWGNASWGNSSWGGDYDLSNMVEVTNWCRGRISNAQRISVRFVSNVTEPHVINWFSAEIEDKGLVKVPAMEIIT